MNKYQIFFKLEGSYTVEANTPEDAEREFDEMNSIELAQRAEHMNIELEDIA